MPSYKGDVNQTIELLQAVVATELVCVLRYQMHAIAAEGIDSKSVAAEFAEHAENEQKHMLWAAARINQLGGVPNLSPDGLASRAAEPKFTWASIGLFRAALFDDIPVGTRLALRPKLELALDQRRLRAKKYDGRWTDVGTMERLAALNAGG